MNKNNDKKYLRYIVFHIIVLIICQMPLSYSQQIQEIEVRTGVQCVTGEYNPTQGVYYRFTFDKIEHPNNFKPVALIASIKNPKCRHLALSFYDTEINAMNAFKGMKINSAKKKQNLTKTFGDYLAIGELTQNDGYKGDHRDDGHFEFFTNDSANLSSQFKIIKKLV